MHLQLRCAEMHALGLHANMLCVPQTAGDAGRSQPRKVSAHSYAVQRQRAVAPSQPCCAYETPLVLRENYSGKAACGAVATYKRRAFASVQGAGTVANQSHASVSSVESKSHASTSCSTLDERVTRQQRQEQQQQVAKSEGHLHGQNTLPMQMRGDSSQEPDSVGSSISSSSSGDHEPYEMAGDAWPRFVHGRGGMTWHVRPFRAEDMAAVLRLQTDGFHEARCVGENVHIMDVCVRTEGSTYMHAGQVI